MFSLQFNHKASVYRAHAPPSFHFECYDSQSGAALDLHL